MKLCPLKKIHQGGKEMFDYCAEENCAFYDEEAGMCVVKALARWLEYGTMEVEIKGERKYWQGLSHGHADSSY
jgi:hypothetical protein